MNNSFGSIHGTLVHLIGAEDVWLQRLYGVNAAVFIRAENYPAYESVKPKWKETEEGWRKYISGVHDEDLRRTLNFKNLKGEEVTQIVWMALQHLVNHSTYHRGQI